MDLYPAYSLAIYLGPVLGLLTMFDANRITLALSLMGMKNVDKIQRALPTIWMILALLWPVFAAIGLIVSVKKWLT